MSCSERLKSPQTALPLTKPAEPTNWTVHVQRRCVEMGPDSQDWAENGPNGPGSRAPSKGDQAEARRGGVSVRTGGCEGQVADCEVIDVDEEKVKAITKQEGPGAEDV